VGGALNAAQVGLLATSASRLTLVRTSIAGGPGVDEVPGKSFARAGATGASISFSSAAIEECAVQGGLGAQGDTGSFTFSRGGDAIAAGFTTFGVLGGTALGGDDDLNPGSGIAMFGFDVWVRDAEIHAGALTGPGVPANDLNLFNAALATFTEPLRSASLPCPVREGDGVSVHLVGVPGDGVLLYTSFDAGLTKLTKAQGSYTLGPPLGTPLFFGTITDPSGTLDVGIHIPPLPPGVDGLVAFLQPVMAPAGGGSVLGTGTALVWIDSSF
jgi:hypothetical protein